MFVCDEELRKLQALPRGETFFLDQKPTRTVENNSHADWAFIGSNAYKNPG